MPVYVRKNLLSITPESLGGRSSDEEDYIRDPEQMYDVLPQPFRLVNKIVNLTFDLAWEVISKREAARVAEKSRVRPPQYDCAILLTDYGQALCMADSPDGRYLFLGMPDGIAMIDAMTQTPVASWDHGSEDGDVCSLKICPVGVRTYLIIAIDTAGTGRLLCSAFEAILPIKTFNEDTAGSIVTNAFISNDGDYLSVALQNGTDVWLDVWHLPRDNWLRELETARGHSNALKQQQQQQQQQQAKPAEADKQDSSIEMATSIEGITTDTEKSTSSGSVRGSPSPHPGGVAATQAAVATPSLNMSQMSKPTTVLRVRPPASSLTGVSGSVASVFRAIDEGQVVGLGTKQHLVSEQHLERRRQVFRQQHQEELRFLNDQDDKARPEPLCVFLNPSFLLVTGLESSNDRPNSVAVAWTGSPNVCHYNLLKPSKDPERKPDVVWPFGSDVTCLAASPCTSLLAVGHRDGTLTVYDQHMGMPRAVQKLSALGAVSRVLFLNPGILPPSHQSSGDPSAPDTHLVTHCTDGSVAVARCGREGAVTLRVVEPASGDAVERVVSVQPLTGIPQAVIVVRGGGEVSLVDVRRGHALCVVALRAADCRLTAMVPPVISPAANANMLYVKGVKESSEGSDKTADSNMFVFPLRSFPALDPFMKNPTDLQPYSVHVLAQRRFQSLLSKRLSLQNERQQRMQQRWRHLSPQVVPCK